MKALRTYALLILALPGCLLANENPACSNANESFIDNSATELRHIAVTCTNPAVARLFYNRAYYKDLLAEEQVLSGLETLHDESRYQITSYSMYIALVEEMAPLYYPDIKRRVAFLNEVYERRGEVLELRIRGYDKLADALERKLLF